MSGYAIEVGEPREWVHVAPFGPMRGICAGFAVTCDRCRRPWTAYLPYLAGNRDAVRVEVEKHNACSEGT